MSTALKQFLVPLESMSHRSRQRFMLEFGSTIGKGASYVIPEVNARGWDVTKELAHSSVHYHRLLASLALRGCFLGNSHPEEITTILELCEGLLLDPSRSVSLLNIQTVVRLSPAEKLAETMLTVQLDYLVLMCKCTQQRREDGQEVIDALFEKPMTNKRRGIVSSFVSAAVVERYTDEDLLNSSRRTIFKLAQNYPEWISSRLNQLAAPTAADQLHPLRLRSALTGSMIALAKSGKPRSQLVGFQLMDRELPRSSDSVQEINSILELYLRYSLLPTVEHVLKHREFYQGQVNQRFTRRQWKVLGQHLNLVESLIELNAIPSVFNLERERNIPAVVRRLVYQKYRDRLVKQERAMPSEAVGRLADQEDRHKEARNGLQVPEVQEDPARTMAYLGILPFDEALTKGKEYLHSSEMWDRKNMMDALGQCARYEEAALDRYLDLCCSQKNEEGTVHLAALGALSHIPTHRWKASHIAKVEALVEMALHSGSTAKGCFNTMEELLVRITTQQPDLAIPLLKRVVAADGDLRSPFLKNIPFELQKRILLSLIPVVESTMKSKRLAGVVNTVFIRFGKPFLRRAVSFPEVNLLLHRMLYELAGFDAPHAAAQLIEKYFPLSKSLPILEKLLTDEPDAYAIVSSDFIAKEVKGDILSRYLVPFNYHGRLVPKRAVKTLILFPSKHFYRWTETQQKVYAESGLTYLSKEGEMEGFITAHQAIITISKLPSITIDDGIRPYLADKDAWMRRLVIGCLANMNDEGSLEVLQQAVQEKDGSAEAIVALRVRVANLPGEDVVRIMKPVLSVRSISVQKEAVRILGDNATAVAFQALMEFEKAKGEDMHRDVQIAFMRAMWNYLEREEVWRFFEDALEKGKSSVYRAVCQIPEDAFTKQWQLDRYRKILLRVLHSSDPSVVLEALNRLIDFKGKGDQIPEELSALCFRFLESPSASLGQTVLRLILSFTTVEVDSIAHRLASTKNDHSLARTVDGVVNFGSSASRMMKPMVASLAQHLRKELIAQRRQVRLACQLIFVENPDTWISSLEELIHAELLHPGCYDLPIGVNFFYEAKEPLLSTEAKCRVHENAVVQRVGLEIAMGLGNVHGYTKEIRAAIEAYRKLESNPWVRDAALLVKMGTEEEEENKQPFNDCDGEDDWDDGW